MGVRGTRSTRSDWLLAEMLQQGISYMVLSPIKVKPFTLVQIRLIQYASLSPRKMIAVETTTTSISKTSYDSRSIRRAYPKHLTTQEAYNTHFLETYTTAAQCKFPLAEELSSLFQHSGFQGLESFRQCRLVSKTSGSRLTDRFKSHRPSFERCVSASQLG